MHMGQDITLKSSRNTNKIMIKKDNKRAMCHYYS
jgi:hypothetical protein